MRWYPSACSRATSARPRNPAPPVTTIEASCETTTITPPPPSNLRLSATTVQRLRFDRARPTVLAAHSTRPVRGSRPGNLHHGRHFDRQPAAQPLDPLDQGGPIRRRRAEAAEVEELPRVRERDQVSRCF